MNELSSKNECGKTRPKDEPYEVWVTGLGVYHILKKYKSPKGEAADPYSRWFVYHPETGDMGDEYASNFKKYGRRIK